MLNKLQKRLAYHLQAGTNSIKFLLQKPMASLMTVIVIGMTLTLPTLFWLFTDNLQHLTHDWRRGGHVLLYLESPLSSSDETALLAQVRETSGVETVYLNPQQRAWLSCSIKKAWKTSCTTYQKIHCRQ